MAYPTSTQAEELLKIDLINDIANAVGTWLKAYNKRSGDGSSGNKLSESRVKSMLSVIDMRPGSVIMRVQVQGDGAAELSRLLLELFADKDSMLRTKGKVASKTITAKEVVKEGKGGQEKEGRLDDAGVGAKTTEKEAGVEPKAKPKAKAGAREKATAQKKEK